MRGWCVVISDSSDFLCIREKIVLLLEAPVFVPMMIIVMLLCLYLALQSILETLYILVRAGKTFVDFGLTNIERGTTWRQDRYSNTSYS